MRGDEEPPEPEYDGPFVVIGPEGLGWRVEIEPPLPTGEGSPRTFGSKHEAFSAAQDLWTAHRLPALDLTVPQTAKAHRKE